MADFIKEFEILDKIEGGYTNNPKDRGKETYKGISRKSHPDWSGWKIIDSMKKAVNFPKNLDANKDLQNSVKNFYKKEYWDAISGDNINNQRVAGCVFDFAVHAGIKISAKLIQGLVNAKQDGDIGPKTLAAINNNPDPAEIVEDLTIKHLQYYAAICKKNRSQRGFFFGWTLRALSKLEEAA